MKLERADWLIAAYVVAVGLVIALDLSPPLWGAGLVAPLSGAALWRASGVGLRATLSWTVPLSTGAVVIWIADEPAVTLLVAGLQGVVVLVMQWPPAADRWVRLFERDRYG